MRIDDLVILGRAAPQHLKNGRTTICLGGWSYEHGFIAQELQETQKDNDADYLKLVMDKNPDRLEASYGRLVPILVNAITATSSKLLNNYEAMEAVNNGANIMNQVKTGSESTLFNSFYNTFGPNQFVMNPSMSDPLKAIDLPTLYAMAEEAIGQEANKIQAEIVSRHSRRLRRSKTSANWHSNQSSARTSIMRAMVTKGGIQTWINTRENSFIEKYFQTKELLEAENLTERERYIAQNLVTEGPTEKPINPLKPVHVGDWDEKILKGFMYGLPTFVNGRQGTCKIMEELGFDMLTDYNVHDYDSEPDDIVRIDKMLDCAINFPMPNEDIVKRIQQNKNLVTSKKFWWNGQSNLIKKLLDNHTV